MTEDEVVEGITDSMDINLSKLQEMVGQGSLTCCSLWGCKELDKTQQLNNNLYISPFFWTSFPFKSPQCIKQSSLCYMHICISYLFYTWYQQGMCINPNSDTCIPMFIAPLFTIGPGNNLNVHQQRNGLGRCSSTSILVSMQCFKL